jgi:hypothetical protein
METLLESGDVVVRFLSPGESWRSGRRGEPPIQVEREPCVQVLLKGETVRIVNISGLAITPDTGFCGTHKRKFWQLTLPEVFSVKRKARELAQGVAPNPPPPVKAPRARRAVPARGLRLFNKPRLPRAAFANVDVDYWKKLSPEVKAFLDQALGELYANGWAPGLEPFYVGEERRQIQFEYNRRYRDIWNHPESFRLTGGNLDEQE